MSEHTQTVSDEVLESEFNRFLDKMDLREKVESTRLEPEDVKAIADAKETLISAMRRGSLVIDDEGQPVFTPQGSKDATPITFREPGGAELQAMDTVKTGHSIAKQNALMGAITGEGAKRFANLKNRDYRVCRDITVLFLA